MTPRRRLAGAMAWVAGLGAAALALQWAGRGALAAPPLSDPGRWGAWLEARDPIVAAFGLLRVAALAALLYVVGATVAGVVLRLIGAASLVRVADRLTIAPVRRMLAGSVSLGLAASGLVAVAAPALRVPVAAARTTTTTVITNPPSATVTMHRLSPAETTATPAVAPVPQVAAAGPGTWTVKPGECFWSIAETVLTKRGGRSPTDGEIAPYWRRLVDANRHQLAQRDNPDLIFPGQVFTVPTP